MLAGQGMLNAVGGLFAIVFAGGLGDGMFDLACAVLIVSGAWSAAYALRERNPTDLRASMLFFANLIPVFAVLWGMEAASAGVGVPWDPFEAHQLSCLTIAMLAPPVAWIGLFSISLVPALAFAQYVTMAPEVVGILPAKPLAAPFVYAAFGILLYLYRLRAIRISRLAANQEAHARAMARMSRTILSVKDLANSPLQALLLDAETLKLRSPEDLPIAKRIEQATAQLKELNHILDVHLRENQG